jgi:hypothetical protein
LGVNFDERTAVACHVQKIRSVVDIHPVGAAGGKQPVLHCVQCRQSSNQHHGRLADCEEHSFGFRIDYAPAWPPGKVSGPSPVALQSEHLKLRLVGFVPDASDDRGSQG